MTWRVKRATLGERTVSVLVVHVSNASRRRHFERLRQHSAELGERLLLIMKNPSWESGFVDRVVTADTSDLVATVAAARELAATEHETIRGVVAFVEHSVPVAAAVAAELGLPFVSERTAYLARDKHAMRTAFAAGGVPQPPFGVARTVAEALVEAGRIGYPLVLKPILGGGSKYVRRVDGPDELAEHFDTTRRGAWDGFSHDSLRDQALRTHGEGLLLEAYLPGVELCVESLVIGGRTSVVAVHDKPTPMDGPFFEELYHATPSRLPASVLAKVVAITTAAHDALGIDIGATHTELRVDDGEPRILETAARLGGGAIYQSVVLSTGVDMVSAVLELSLGIVPDVRPFADPVPVGGCFFFAEKAGRVVAVHGLDEVSADPQVREVDLYVQPGVVVDVPPHVSQAHGGVLFTADTAAGLDDVFDRLVKTIRIETA
jgi:biotin carboxylase